MALSKLKPLQDIIGGVGQALSKLGQNAVSSWQQTAQNPVGGMVGYAINNAPQIGRELSKPVNIHSTTPDYGLIQAALPPNISRPVINYFQNQIVNPANEAHQAFQKPGVLNKGIGLLKTGQSLLSATPQGAAFNTLYGGVSGALRTARTGQPLKQSIVQGITEPSDIGGTGLGIQNPLLAMGVDIATANPRGAMNSLSKFTAALKGRELSNLLKAAPTHINQEIASKAISNARNLDRMDYNLMKEFSAAMQGSKPAKASLPEISFNAQRVAEGVFGPQASTWTNQKMAKAFDWYLQVLDRAPGYQKNPIPNLNFVGKNQVNNTEAEIIGKNRLPVLRGQASTPSVPETLLTPQKEQIQGLGKAMQQGIVPIKQAETKMGAGISEQTGNNSFTGSIDNLFQGIKGKVDKIYTEALDRLHPISKLGKQAGEDQKIRNAITGYYGAGSIGKYHTDYELSPILKSVDVNELRRAAIALRDAELKQRGIRGSNTNALDGLLKQGQIGDKEQLAKVGVALKKLYAYQDNLVQQYLVNTGIMSQKAYNSMKANNQFYVPFKRVMDTVDEYLGGTPQTKGAGSVGSQNVIKGIKGSERQIVDPIQSIIENTYKIVGLGQRQKVAKAIASLKDQLPEGMIKKVNGHTLGQSTISVFENGKAVKYKVPMEVADAAKGLSEEGLNTIVKILAAPTRVFRATATGVNPEFAIPNTARDLQSAFVNIGLNPLKFVSGLAHYMKRDDVYQEFLKSGGLTSRISLDQPFLKQSVKDLSQAPKPESSLMSAIAKTPINVLKTGISLKDPRNIYKVLQAIGQASEQPTRIAAFQKAYNQALKTGLSLEEARARGAYAAQEATVNFARRGSKTQSLNAIYAFLNARAQGVDRLVRSFKNDPVGVSTRVGMITAAPALALYAWNRNFPSFNDPRIVTPSDKQNNFIIMLSDNPVSSLGGAQYIKIPKGDVGKLANPLESFLSYADGKGGDIAQSLKNVLSAFSPITNIGDTIPTAIRPVVESAANKNFFTGFPIVPESKKNYPAQFQTSKSTAPIYNQIGAMTNQSPNQIQNLTRGYLTGFARLGEMATTPFAKKDNYSGEDINQVPVIRRFLGGAVRSEEEQQLNDLFKQKGIERQVQDIKTGIKHGDIPLNDGINAINKLMNTNQPALPSQSQSYFGIKEAGAAEENLSPQQKIQNEIAEYQAKNKVEMTGKPQEANGKLFYLNENGNSVSIPLNRQLEEPNLTGDPEVDKIKLQKYSSQFTSKINDIIKLNELGKLSNEEMVKQISDLKAQQKAVQAKYAKPKKPKQIKVPRLKISQAKLKTSTKKIKLGTDLRKYKFSLSTLKTKQKK